MIAVPRELRGGIWAACLPLLTLGLLAAAPADGPHPVPPAPGVDPVCEVNPNMPLEGRASPLDSASVQVGDGVVKVCYGAPSARGRTMIGGEHVPFGELWRTGANEATTLHTTVAVRLGDLSLEPGAYTLYTKPGPDEWELFVSRATGQWGTPITDEVRAQEVGSLTLPRERPPEHVETMKVRFDRDSPRRAAMILEWEEFRIAVPVEAGGS